MQILFAVFRRFSLILLTVMISLAVLSTASQPVMADTIPFTYRYSIPGVLDLSGDTVVFRKEIEGQPTGVHAAVLNDYGWIDQGALIPNREMKPNEELSAYNGWIDGDTAVLISFGSCGSYGELLTTGAVFIFKRTGTSWSQQQEITTPCGSGAATTLDGSTLVIPHNIPVPDEENGYNYLYPDVAQVYQFNGTSWVNTGAIDLDPTNCICVYSDMIQIAVSGDTILIGTTNSGVEQGARIYQQSGSTWLQQAVLPYPEEFPALDLDDDTAIVGKAVYIRSGGTWTLQTTFDFEPVETTYPPYSAYQISLEGDQFIFFGILDNGNYGWGVMVRSGNTWTKEPIQSYIGSGRLKLSGDTALFGTALLSRAIVPNEVPYASRYFLSGNTLLFQDRSTMHQHSEIHVRNPVTKIWELQQEIAEYSVIGSPKALQGDTAVFTTYGDDGRPPEPGEENPYIPGTLTVLKRTGITWTKQQTLEFNPNFGTDADIDGNTILVSDPGQYDSYTRTVHFVEYDGTTWHITQSFDVDSGPGSASVELSGDLALVTVESGQNGFFRTYHRVNGTWIEKAPLDAGGISWFDLSGNTAVIENRVYVFDGTNWSLQATLSPNEPVSGQLIGAIEGDTIVLASEFKSFVFTRSGTVWTQQQKLMIGGYDIGYPINVELAGGVALIRRYTFDIGSAPTDPTPTPVVTDEVPLPTVEPTAEVTETVTPPATDEPTPVVTDEPTDEPTTEPTSGPTATSTPQTDSALNANTGFETGSLEPWKVRDSSGDKLKCSAEKAIAYTGACAFRFNNGKGSSGKLVQKIDFSTRMNPISGNALELSLYAKTKGGVEGTAKVVVRFADGSRQKFGVDLTDTAKAYMAFSQNEVLTQTAIAKVKLVIRGTNAQGKLFVDDVTLRSVEVSSSLDVLPLP